MIPGLRLKHLLENEHVRHGECNDILGRLHLAVQDVAKLKKRRREERDTNELHKAILDSCLFKVEKLLDRIEVPDRRGRTPLITAIYSRDPKMVETIVLAGAGVNVPHTVTGMSPLFIARMIAAPPGICRLLVKMRAVEVGDVTTPTYVFGTSLYLGVEVLKKLVDSGAAEVSTDIVMSMLARQGTHDEDDAVLHYCLEKISIQHLMRAHPYFPAAVMSKLKAYRSNKSCAM